MDTNNFDPIKEGATKVDSSTTTFDPIKLGATRISDTPIPTAHRDVLQKATDILTKIFPGKQVGEAIGTLVGYGLSNHKDQYDTSAPTPLQVVGDVAQGALAVSGIGAVDNSIIGKVGFDTAKTALGRIGVNAAVGTGIGATGAIAEGQSAGDVLKQGAMGGVAGGALSAATEGVSALAQNLPKWFTQAALPKMKDAQAFKYIPNEAGGYTRTAQESASDYALNNTKGLSVSKMLEHSNKSVDGFRNQIDTILSHPEYTRETGNGAQAITDALTQFPEAQLTESKVIGMAKQLAPESKALVDKVADGTATLAEKNALRSELDSKIYIKFPEKTLTFNQKVGKVIADSLRGDVQTTAPETVPIFNKFSKELTLNQALQRAVNKKTVAGDILAGGAGFAKGGLKGAAEAILIEKGLRSPSVLLNAAKLARGTSRVATPILSTAIRAGKAPLIKRITDNQK